MRVTASKVGLLAACQWFARPEAEWLHTTSAAADRGTRFHRAIALYVNTVDRTPIAVEEDIAREYVHAREWVDSFGKGALAAEVAFGWDPTTDRAHRLDVVDRAYPPGLLCGTADIVAVSRAMKAGYVADWKTGSGEAAGPQLRALALMLARSEGLETVTVEALEVTADGVEAVATETLDAFALDAVAGELAEACAAVPTSEPVPGPHCGEMYCPARATCPAGAAVLAEVIPAEALVRHRWTIDITGPDHAVWLLDHARLVEAAAKAVKDAVKAYVPPEGLPLEDGRVLVEGTREMPRFDKAKAIALLKQLGATPAQIDALTYTWKESAGLRVVSPGAKAPRKRRAA